MRTVKYSNKFKKHYKKLVKNNTIDAKIEHDLKNIIFTLANDNTLERKYNDHKLLGFKENIRELHIRPDLLLEYMKSKNELVLLLIDIGTHSNLFK